MSGLLSFAGRRALADVRHVTPVPPAEARGIVKAVYEQLERDFGMLAPPVALHSPAPSLMAAVWAMLRETLLVTETVPRATKEAVATEVSIQNSCGYCADVHGALRGAEVAGPDVELRAVAVTFQYLNRMVDVFLPPSPLPAAVPAMARPVALRAMGRLLRRDADVTPGLSLDLLPPADLPADLAWLRENPRLAETFARAAAAIERSAEPWVSRPHAAELSGAMRRNAADAGVVARFREHDPGDAALLGVLAKTALDAARAAEETSSPNGRT